MPYMQRSQRLASGVSGATRLLGGHDEPLVNGGRPMCSSPDTTVLWSAVEWPEMLLPVKPTGGCALSWKCPAALQRRNEM